MRLQLLSSLLWFISITNKLVDASHLHVSLPSRKELPSVLLEKAHSNGIARDSAAPGVRRIEADGSISTSVFREDVSLSLLQSLSSRLKHWGTPATDKLQPLAHTGDSFSAFHRQEAKSESSAGPRLATLLLTVGILVTLLSCMCACFGRWWDDEDEMKGPDPTLSVVENCNGPWAKAYRDSHGQRREAIELLFKCNIITMPEFSNYATSGQHSDVEQCVQIGICMLQERPTSEWEAAWQDAQKTFELKAADGGFYTPI